MEFTVEFVLPATGEEYAVRSDGSRHPLTVLATFGQVAEHRPLGVDEIADLARGATLFVNRQPVTFDQWWPRQATHRPDTDVWTMTLDGTVLVVDDGEQPVALPAGVLPAVGRFVRVLCQYDLMRTGMTARRHVEAIARLAGDAWRQACAVFGDRAAWWDTAAVLLADGMPAGDAIDAAALVTVG